MFTERLKADLRRVAWNHQYLIEYYESVLGHAERVVASFEGTTGLDDEALLISAYRATQYLDLFPQRATYDELLSTGTLGLIHDDTLRASATAIFNAKTFERIAEEGVTSRYRVAFRMLLAPAVQRRLAAACGDRSPEVGDYRSIVDPLDYPCETGLEPAEIVRAVEALRRDPTLLRLRIADIETRLGDLTALDLGSFDGLRPLVEQGQR